MRPGNHLGTTHDGFAAGCLAGAVDDDDDDDDFFGPGIAAAFPRA